MGISWWHLSPTWRTNPPKTSVLTLAHRLPPSLYFPMGRQASTYVYSAIWYQGQDKATLKEGLLSAKFIFKGFFFETITSYLKCFSLESHTYPSKKRTFSQRKQCCFNLHENPTWSSSLQAGQRCEFTQKLVASSYLKWTQSPGDSYEHSNGCFRCEHSSTKEGAGFLMSWAIHRVKYTIPQL